MPKPRPSLLCECEFAQCTVEHTPKLHAVPTIFGTYTLCGACIRNHPIPSEYLRRDVTTDETAP